MSFLVYKCKINLHLDMMYFVKKSLHPTYIGVDLWILGIKSSFCDLKVNNYDKRYTKRRQNLWTILWHHGLSQRNIHTPNSYTQ